MLNTAEEFLNVARDTLSAKSLPVNVLNQHARTLTSLPDLLRGQLSKKVHYTPVPSFYGDSCGTGLACRDTFLYEQPKPITPYRIRITA